MPFADWAKNWQISWSHFVSEKFPIITFFASHKCRNVNFKKHSECFQEWLHWFWAEENCASWFLLRRFIFIYTTVVVNVWMSSNFLQLTACPINLCSGLETSNFIRNTLIQTYKKCTYLPLLVYPCCIIHFWSNQKKVIHNGKVT